MKKIKTYNNFNESIKDKLIGKSYDEIRNSLGEDKYKIWKIYNKIINLPEPFEIGYNYTFNNYVENNYTFTFRFWWIYFNISYNGKEWNYSSTYNSNINTKDGVLNTWDEVFNEMKKDIHKYFNMEKELLNKEIKKHQNNIKNMDESLLKLDNMEK